MSVIMGGFCKRHYSHTDNYPKETHETKLECQARYKRSLPGKYADLRISAKNRGLGFDISEDQYREIVQENKCVYCGERLPITGHGLDRKDSSIGYVGSNVVPCCTTCNRFKNNILTYDEMVAVTRFLKEFRASQETS